MNNSYDNPVSQRLYDKENSRIIYIGEISTPKLWDSLWSMNEFNVMKFLAPTRGTDKFVKFIDKYLKPTDGIIFEGGCGRGQYVAALERAGYKSIGLDYAKDTVCLLNKYAPNLDVRLGDLRMIPLPDSSVIGYVSLGVIEHFWDGYDPLAIEMARILKKGGYLFLSFPYMSPFRILKARLGGYTNRIFSKEPDCFYQFALCHNEVIRILKKYGFKVEKKYSQSGLKGILGEIGFLSGVLNLLYSFTGKSIFIRAIRFGLDKLLTFVGCGHSIMIIFRRYSIS